MTHRTRIALAALVLLVIAAAVAAVIIGSNMNGEMWLSWPLGDVTWSFTQTCE